MGTVREPGPGLLFLGLLWTDGDLCREAVSGFVEDHGPVILSTPEEVFPWARYYEPEMGEGIRRSYMFFDALIPRNRLAEIKLATNAVEGVLRAAGGRAGRPVNLDPGYVTPENLVLATTKSRPHRIYLGSGIYGESTLGFEKGRYHPWPWTYPDYARPVLAPFFLAARNILKDLLK
ncbi:MAG: DUF4416 family protein [Planctomycetes bacterium]|nr:DUF4416 family protein [Planctomycetota bacterium]